MNEKTRLIMIIAGVFLLILVVLAIIILGQDDEEEKPKYKAKVKNISKINKKYHFYINNFFTRGSFKRIVTMVSDLSTYNMLEIREQSVKFYETSLFMSLGLLVIGGLIFRDILSIVLLSLYCVIMQNVLVHKKIDNVKYDLIKQLSTALSSLRESYIKTGIIPDAFNVCEKGDLLKKPFDKIYIILTANDAKEKLDEFQMQNPFRLLRTLAIVSYIINDKGDVQIEGKGSSYKEALLVLKREVDLEIRKQKLLRLKFQMLGILPIVPLFMMSFFQSFFSSNISGTTPIYQGMYGYVSKLIIVLVSLISYYMIATINREVTSRENDRSEIIDTLLTKKKFKRFVGYITPKALRKRLKMSKLLKGALSQKDIEYIYAAKVVTATVAFIFSLVAFMFITAISKDYLYSNTASMSISAIDDYSVEEVEMLRKVDAEYLAMDELPAESQITEKYQGALPSRSEMEAMDQKDRIIKKWKKYKNLYFKWYYVLLCYLIALISWKLPEAQILLRAYLVRTEAEDDVLQLQTLISILMYTPLDTLSVLYWMAETSIIHKDAITFAYYEYPSNAEKAIDRMKSKSSIATFHQICQKLTSTIEKISLLDAFSDLAEDRQHTLSIKEMTQQESINKRRQIASPISIATMVVMVILHILGPMCILGASEFANMMQYL